MASSCSADSSPELPLPSPQKSDSKPQATFLTKLYALLERPENHHMIRWDPAGEYIIVERPEQLALHVLPSIYRQSRFASFSRQLNVRPLLLFSSPNKHFFLDLWLHAQG